MKRLFDLLVSLAAIICALPILLITAVAIKLDSKGGVLFKQARIGLNGKHFSIYKFRSMVIGAARSGPYFTEANDRRITRVGAFIRRTSLDELPQILNVLQGDMSIVGPRPNVPEQEKEYANNQWVKRNSVKPGITGLAQATLRSQATPEQRTALDLEYVDKNSMGMDLRIILMTVKQILSKGGN
ncbi:sugar transferase [Endozoicomonas ascidiicola]|uniref:sugar transferase n=1 Tax=Endozoicomonas ascidiicola TaxID=1698521 RepID=UPI000829872B|nr:sugar transferase [Endozoicomonas ascidiicola]